MIKKKQSPASLERNQNVILALKVSPRWQFTEFSIHTTLHPTEIVIFWMANLNVYLEPIL